MAGLQSRSDLIFQAKGKNTLPLFPDHVWEIIISSADFCTLPKLCVVCIMFYYSAKEHLGVRPGLLNGYWGLVFGNDMNNHFAAGNLEMRRGGVLANGMSALSKAYAIAAVGCWKKSTISVNQFFYGSSVRLSSRVAIILANLNHNPKNEYSFFEGVFASLMTDSMHLITGHIAGVRMSKLQKPNLDEEWGTIVESLNNPNDPVEHVLPEIEQEGLAHRGWSESEANRFLVSKFPSMIEKWNGRLVSKLNGQWHLHLTFAEKKVIDLTLVVVDRSPFAVKAKITKCKKRDAELSVEGSALMCVNEMSIVGISAAFITHEEELHTVTSESVCVLSSIGVFNNSDYDDIVGDCTIQEGDTTITGTFSCSSRDV